ncbi:unnamed protein product, partial [Didymodactylos carnosus]
MLGIFTVVITIHQQNAAAKQRAEDLNATLLQRIQELAIANNQSEANRQMAIAQKEQEKERYQNDALAAYIKEMGELLKDSNGSLTSNPVTATVARVKTLNVFRQIDPPRKVHILRFLYEASQLTNIDQNPPLDLTTADLY